MRSKLAVRAGLLAAMSMVVALALATNTAIRLHREATDWVEHTRIVLEASEELESSAQGTELAAYAFLLGREPSALDRYRQGQTETWDSLNRLLQMTRDNPGQQPALEQARGRLTEAFTLMDAAVAAPPSGAMNRPFNLRLSDIAAPIEADEESLLARREMESARTARSLLAVTVGGSAILLLLLVAAAMTVRSALRERERAAEFQARLIAIVAHDIRGPLGVILTGSHLLRRQNGHDEKAVRALERIDRSATRIEEVARIIVDYTQAGLGRGLVLHRESGDLAAVAEAAAADLRERSPARQVRVEVRGRADGSFDPARLRQALANLLQNADQYGAPDTPIDVAVQGGESLEVRVHNQGAPIPPERLERIFQPFERGADAPSSSNMGLGLYIVAEIVRAHGGRLEVSSSQAAGTSFIARFPSGA